MLQRHIITAVLDVLRTAQEPGTLVSLPFKWDEDDPEDRWERTAPAH